MILHEVPNPDAEILITQGDAADQGAVLIAYLPFYLSRAETKQRLENAISNIEGEE